MLPIRLSELPEAPSNVVQSGVIPVSDIPNDTTLKLSLQQIPLLLEKQNIKIKTSSYTLSKNDYNSVLYFNNAINTTSVLNIPNHFVNSIPLGYSIKIIRYNLGHVQISPANGVTVYSTNGLYLHSQYSLATLTKIEHNTWIITGHLSSKANSLYNGYVVSGAGTASFNGNYYYDPVSSAMPESNGYPVYQHDTNNIYIYFNSEVSFFQSYVWIGSTLGAIYASSDGYYTTLDGLVPNNPEDDIISGKTWYWYSCCSQTEPPTPSVTRL